MKKTYLAIGACALALVGVAQGEIIGPWNIVAAPANATEIVGGGGSWSSITPTATSASIFDAFTGFSIIEDGYANGAAGTTVQVDFAFPIINGPGNELVMFDSRFSFNSYTFSSAWDGFSFQLALNAANFIDSGEDRSYFYSGIGGNVANVMGHEIDLSALGVPLGAGVSSFRFTGTSSEVDPLGVGALVPAPSAALTLGLAGALIARRRRKA
jgi:hypothetical protein